MSYSDLLRKVIAAPIPFSPLDLFQSGEQGVWLDSSDLSTMFQDSAGNTPVTTDGDPVGLIQDKSGNGWNAFQETPANRPVYRTDGYLQFSGGQGLVVSNFDITNHNEITNFYGITKNQNATQAVSELSIEWFSGAGRFMDRVDTSNRFISSGRGDSGSIVAQEVAVTFGGVPETVVYSCIHSIPDDLTRLRINRNNTADATGNKGAGNFGLYDFFIGARNQSSLYLNGRIYQLIISGTRRDVPTIEAMEDYIAEKIGITL